MFGEEFEGLGDFVILTQGTGTQVGGGWTAVTRAWVTAVLAVGLAIGPAAYDVAAQSSAPPPQTHAVRTTEAPTIDGSLDEEVWTTAPALEGFTQREPIEGNAASQRTVARVLFDDSGVYIAVWAFDNRPFGNHLRRKPAGYRAGSVRRHLLHPG